MKMTTSGRSGGRGNAKMERKVVEKNRRIQMKSLCMKLASLIPKEHNSTSTKDILSQQDHLDQATSYIKKLQKRIESMKQRRAMRMNIQESSEAIADGVTTDFSEAIADGVTMDLWLPVVEVRHRDSNMEVVLISGLDRRFMFHEVIKVLEEEGAEVVNASFSVVGEKIFHIIHSQAISPRLGWEASRVLERLKSCLPHGKRSRGGSRRVLPAICDVCFWRFAAWAQACYGRRASASSVLSLERATAGEPRSRVFDDGNRHRSSFLASQASLLSDVHLLRNQQEADFSLRSICLSDPPTRFCTHGQDKFCEKNKENPFLLKDK